MGVILEWTSSKVTTTILTELLKVGVELWHHLNFCTSPYLGFLQLTSIVRERNLQKVRIHYVRKRWKLGMSVI